jgi:two-component system, response regulator YesN
MGTLRIILVDDEPPILHGLQTHVPWRDLGYEVVGTCGSASCAMSILRERPVDVILSDIRMPGMDGLEFCRVARAEFPELVVLFLTAHRDFEYATRAVELGAWRFLVKPTNFAVLYATLEELRCSRKSSCSGENCTSPEQPDLAQRVADWVESHFQEASLERAAAVVGLNPQYLSRRYHEITGEHFSDLVQRTRMEHAARLLSNSRFRTYEISSIVGYTSPKNFTRRFREYHGVPPAQFRKSRDGEYR